MIRIMHTADLHLGREYKKQELENREIAQTFKDARLKALKKMIVMANEYKCDYLIIAGDLFDKKDISVNLQKEVCDLLGGFEKTVLILPGNHDYLEEEQDKLWSRFEELAGDNIILLKKNQIMEMAELIIYPCFCNDRYSETNALGWIDGIKNREPDKIHMGIAHGALDEMSFDSEKRYYHMTIRELESKNMDLWLLGHTHIPYPNKEFITGHTIFNPGTHQQTDIADHSEGSAFLIEINDNKKVSARKVQTGIIRFFKEEIVLKHGDSLLEKLNEAIKNMDKENTVLRLQISGVALEMDYTEKEFIYQSVEKDFLKLEIQDSNLEKEITLEMIMEETIEGSVERKLLENYMDQPQILNLAFQLIQRCKGSK